ncbi:MAG: hypothetical protein ACK559_06285, partial [bacterium]
MEQKKIASKEAQERYTDSQLETAQGNSCLYLLGRLLFAKRGHLPEEVLAGGPLPALPLHDTGVGGGDLLPGS